MSDEAGQSLARRFAELAGSSGYGPDLLARDYPEFLDAVLGGAPIRPVGTDPRIHVWGALEARLQRVDTVIVAGLNEGTWPMQPRLDPFLSRQMRQSLELEAPERRVGLAAHDFTQALGQDRVWLTRAEREDGEPRVASRWLQRLTAYAGQDSAQAMRQQGEAILGLARQLDRPADPMPGGGRPCPAPALHLKTARTSSSASTAATAAAPRGAWGWV